MNEKVKDLIWVLEFGSVYGFAIIMVSCIYLLLNIIHKNPQITITAIIAITMGLILIILAEFSKIFQKIEKMKSSHNNNQIIKW